MEIFEKAKEYAGRFPIRDGRYQMPPFTFVHDGPKRLHEQAMKVLDMAMARAKEAPHDTDDSLRGSVYAHIDALQHKYRDGWVREIDDCYYRDFSNPSQLIDMLSFIRKMGVVYTRHDTNQLSESLHLRMSDEDFNIIFHPSVYTARAR
jgi:hypothetical protein